MARSTRHTMVARELSSIGRSDSREGVDRSVDPGLDRFGPALLDRARRMIGPRLRPLIAPSDLLQETLLIAVRRIAEVSGRPSRQVFAWLIQAMRFRLMRYVRDHRIELDASVVPDVDPVGSSSSVPTRMIRAEMVGAMLSRFELLPEPDRQLLLWIYADRLGTSEIAGRLGRTESAVRGAHHRAVARLRRLFEADRP